jgi:hypothetical protein
LTVVDDNESEDDLAARLGGVLARRDPVPKEVIDAAKASAAWRTVDAELALLLYDSVLDEEFAGVRGGGSRLLTFTSPRVTVDIEVLGRGRGMVGQVDGTGPARVEICSAGGAVPVETDASGHFSYGAGGAGPMSVRITDEHTNTVIRTEWVVI